MNTLKLSVSGTVPCFKNRKMIARGKLITNPKQQKIMEQIIESFVSQLLCATQTPVAGTLTGPQAHFAIVSLLPQDDSRQWVPEIQIKAVDCDKGCEGAEIEITQLP